MISSRSRPRTKEKRLPLPLTMSGPAVRSSKLNFKPSFSRSKYVLPPLLLLLLLLLFFVHSYVPVELFDKVSEASIVGA